MADAGFRLSVEGEKEFKEALKTIDAQIKINKSEIKLLTEEYKLNDDSIENLRTRQEVYTDSLNLQGARVQTLEELLGKLTAAYGEEDESVLRVKNQLIDASTAYAKMTAEAESNRAKIEEVTAATEEQERTLEMARQILGETVTSTDALDDALAELDATIGANNAELKNLGKEYGDAEKKSKNLNESIEAQKKKLAILNGEMQLAAQKYGEGSKEAEEYRKKIADATGELDRMTEEVRDNESAVRDSSRNVVKETSELPDILGDVSGMLGVELPQGLETLLGGIGDVSAGFGGWASLLGAGGLVAGAISGAKELMSGAIDSAVELKDKSQLLGLDTKEYQRLEYALGQLGISTEGLTEIFNPLYGKIKETDKVMGDYAKDMSELKYASKDVQKAVVEEMNKWEDYGVTIYDNEGKLRGINDIFYDLIDVYSKFSNKTEAITKLQDIFGESANKLAPLLVTNGENLRKMGEYAEETGLILEENLINSLDNVNNVLGAFGKNWSNAWKGLGAQLVLALQGDWQGVKDAGNFAWSSFEALFKKPKYAYGTYNHPGGYALVGERGPEIVELPQSSRVYPNGVMPETDGGGNVFNITISARDVREFNDIVRIAQGERQAMRMGYVGRR